MKNILYVVVPCYNEHEVIHETTKRLTEQLEKLIKFKKISSESKICYVDDGSKDDTWDIISSLSKTNKFVTGLKLTHNRGHQIALLSGLMSVKEYADMTITVDADLQQDLNSIEKFVDKYHEGYEIVYGIRNSRNKDKFFKRFTATFFYKLMNKLGCESYQNHADYRLVSKKVLNELEKYKESSLYLRGLFPYIGFKSTFVYFDVFERYAGESKYNFKKMLTLATDGITSFSIAPIRFVFILGALLSFGSSIYLFSIIIMSLITSKDLLLWGIVGIILLVGGLIILCIGIIGEYVGKTYFESKQRPNYSVEEFLNGNIK